MMMTKLWLPPYVFAELAPVPTSMTKTMLALVVVVVIHVVAGPDDSGVDFHLPLRD